MKILILTGGTGSIALQKGLYGLLESDTDGFDIKVLVNAYDNGLSTGAVRKVLGGHILGPSDVRKNQTTRLQFQNPNSVWNAVLNIRFTKESLHAEEYCFDVINSVLEADPEVMKVEKRHYDLVVAAVKEYFKSPVATKIDYNDFALANIIYAGLAKMNGNSLRKAASIMAGVMGIPDSVILNDDTSLFLGAKTRSGIQIRDEGDIVSWGKNDDPFESVFFTDAFGKETIPLLCEEAEQAITEADLIILSSGTQWSSLIPTYASAGFKNAIDESKAKIIMVMNKVPDRDSPGQSADDIIKTIVPTYFPVGRVHVLLDSQGHHQMSNVVEAASLVASVKTIALSTEVYTKSARHDPAHLAFAIGKTYFGDAVKSRAFMFDYDDTLVGRGNSLPITSAANRKLIRHISQSKKITICSGNSIKAINLLSDAKSGYYENSEPIPVFADGGVNLYKYNLLPTAEDEQQYTFEECIDAGAVIDAETISALIRALTKNGIPVTKIDNRGNVMISIRPIDPEYRHAILSLSEMISSDFGLEAHAAGRSTIEIAKNHISKEAAVRFMLNWIDGPITFIGDEFGYGGNDLPVAKIDDSRLTCLPVKSPAETHFFLLTLMAVVV